MTGISEVYTGANASRSFPSLPLEIRIARVRVQRRGRSIRDFNPLKLRIPPGSFPRDVYVRSLVFSGIREI